MVSGRGCRVSAHPMPCAVPAAHPGACRGSGTFCSLMRPPSHARVLSPALRAAQTKRQIDVLLSGCISGILRSVPAMLLLSRSSLALCFPGFFLPKERGLGVQDPANPAEMLVQRGVPCPDLCRGCVYPFLLEHLSTCVLAGGCGEGSLQGPSTFLITLCYTDLCLNCSTSFLVSPSNCHSL